MLIGKVTMAKTRPPTVITRVAMSAGRVTAFTGKLPASISRVTVFVGKGAVHFRQRKSRSALPMTIKSETPIAAAQKIGLMKPIAASGTPSAL